MSEAPTHKAASQMPWRAHLLGWTALELGALPSFASVQFPSGLIVDEITVHVRGAREAHLKILAGTDEDTVIGGAA
jgi:hypothetical protein